MGGGDNGCDSGLLGVRQMPSCLRNATIICYLWDTQRWGPLLGRGVSTAVNSGGIKFVDLWPHAKMHGKLDSPQEHANTNHLGSSPILSLTVSKQAKARPTQPRTQSKVRIGQCFLHTLQTPKSSSFPTEGPAPNQARPLQMCPISLSCMVVEEPQQTVMWNNFLCGFTRGWTQPDDIRSAIPDPIVPTSLGRKRLSFTCPLFAYNRPSPLAWHPIQENQQRIRRSWPPTLRIIHAHALGTMRRCYMTIT